jgi:hypothetical protein
MPSANPRATTAIAGAQVVGESLLQLGDFELTTIYGTARAFEHELR